MFWACFCHCPFLWETSVGRFLYFPSRPKLGWKEQLADWWPLWEQLGWCYMRVYFLPPLLFPLTLLLTLFSWFRGGNTHVQQLSRQLQNLNGTIPDSIGDLTQLEELSLSFNSALVGTIPPFYVGLESLTSLTLQYNGLTGSIPPNLGLLLFFRKIFFLLFFSLCVVGQTPNLSNLWLTENLTGNYSWWFVWCPISVYHNYWGTSWRNSPWFFL